MTKSVLALAISVFACFPSFGAPSEAEIIQMVRQISTPLDKTRHNYGYDEMLALEKYVGTKSHVSSDLEREIVQALIRIQTRPITYISQRIQGIQGFPIDVLAQLQLSPAGQFSLVNSSVYLELQRYPDRFLGESGYNHWRTMRSFNWSIISREPEDKYSSDADLWNYLSAWNALWDEYLPHDILADLNKGKTRVLPKYFHLSVLKDILYILKAQPVLYPEARSALLEIQLENANDSDPASYVQLLSEVKANLQKLVWNTENIGHGGLCVMDFLF